MTTRTLFSLLFWTLAYLFLQVFVFRNLVLFHYGFCFLYIATTLQRPFAFPTVPLLFMAFGTGLVVDVFYNTLGLHAASTVLIAYARPLILRLLTPARGYDERINPSIAEMGLRWFISYAFLAALVHHTVLFFLEASTLSLLVPTLGKIGASVLYTTVVLTLFQYFQGE
jgi:hypothetical protein